MARIPSVLAGQKKFTTFILIGLSARADWTITLVDKHSKL
jgi:hypothetical protein